MLGASNAWRIKCLKHHANYAIEFLAPRLGAIDDACPVLGEIQMLSPNIRRSVCSDSVANALAKCPDVAPPFYPDRPNHEDSTLHTRSCRKTYNPPPRSSAVSCAACCTARASCSLFLAAARALFAKRVCLKKRFFVFFVF
jgi:hypothetical protein